MLGLFGGLEARAQLLQRRRRVTRRLIGIGERVLRLVARSIGFRRFAA